MIPERVFGKTGWRVSDIGLGCWQFGGAITLDGKPDGWTGVNDTESDATIRRAVELGLNFFDTADMYGWGHSESVLGRALKGVRDRVYVASKVGYGRDADNHRTLNASREYIVRACEQSLNRLQTDHLDLYQCHLGRTERWGEFLDAFERLQRHGKILQFGVSTNEFAVLRHFDERQNLAAVQTNYNLLQRQAEKEILPYCRARGIAVVVRGPLAMGKLAGRYTPASRFAPQDIRTGWLETEEGRLAFARDLATVERLRPLADKGGFTLAQFAIKFVLANVAVSTVIVGTKNREQLEPNVSASVLPSLTHEELATIEQALRTDGPTE